MQIKSKYFENSISGIFFSKSQDSLSFPAHFVKERQNFIKISPRNRKFHLKTRMENEISFSFRQKFGRFLLKFWDLSGAKV